MNPKVLFLCSGRRVSLVERFKGAGCQVICTDMDPYAPTIKVADSFEFSPSFDDKEIFVERINNICDENKIDAIIPLFDDAIDICCDAKLHAKWFGPDRKTNDILFSKRETIKFFHNLGLLAPNETPNFDPKEDSILVGRDINGCGSRGLHFVHSLEEYKASRVLYNNSIYTYFVPGKEYTIDCYKDMNGNVRGAVPRERIKVRSGEVLVSRTVRHPKIEAEAKLIMNNLSLLGPCTLQCIENENGDLFWIEGNPRFGGGVILTLEACTGRNYAQFVIDDIYGISNDSPVDWHENVVMTRADREFFIHV